MTEPSADLRFLHRCPMCGKANRLPAKLEASLRCGACQLDFDSWLEHVFAHLSAFWRAGLSTLAAVYRPALFPLLERGLTDSHKPCRDEAWKILAEPVRAEREDGQTVIRPRLFDRLTGEQRAALRRRVPRVAELTISSTDHASPAPRDASPRRKRTERSPRQHSTRPGVPRPGTRADVELPSAARDLAGALDGLSLAELAFGARGLQAEAQRSGVTP